MPRNRAIKVRPDRASPLTVACMFALVTLFATAAVVSWSTPDGNLVVTLVPAITVGLATFVLVLWWLRRRKG